MDRQIRAAYAQTPGAVEWRAMRNWKSLLLIGLWALLLAAAFMVDEPVKRALYEGGWHDPAKHLMKGTWWAMVLKWPGHFGLTLVVVGALVWGIGLSWRKGVVILVCGVSALVNDILKWVFGRPRPLNDAGLVDGRHFDFFRGGALGSLKTGGLAFPSGHTTLAFATATCLSVYYPRLTWLFFVLATMVGAERVIELAHHVSDVVASAGLGIALSLIVMQLLRSWSSAGQRPEGSTLQP